MELKDIIKHRRIELGLSQLETAKIVGVSEATISRWESGEISNMRRDRINNLAKALQISPAELVQEENIMTDKEEAEMRLLWKQLKLAPDYVQATIRTTLGLPLLSVSSQDQKEQS